MGDIIEKFSFRIPEIRTDNGYEFQAKFHWQVGDKASSTLRSNRAAHNGKVKRCHRFNQNEFYQLLDDTNDIDLRKKLAVWQRFDNFSRPRGAFNGKTPQEAWCEKPQSKLSDAVA